ncbi:hypothetical protein [Georgenia thermotolerans]|uniref:DUF4287 domain-containing protein n=1 Tax=Georgenia thermotolerans TaxID=527326 RepID=A0A7J5USX6_9MICO|nr:hypothetical protein [Georgenia thermotolerans]KAE8764943.1 hypothetical protein GB883_06540 [Georgenia thermotolerans]
MATRSHAEQVGEERLLAATGRTREGWYALLDEAGAREWDHTHIARWLGGEHDVDAWWAQGVTVGYEQSRGLRAPGQRPDGTYETTVTKTLRATLAQAWPYLADDDLRSEWLDVDWPVMGLTAPRTARFRGDDDSRVLLALSELPPARDGRPRTRVAAAHTRLRDADEVAETRKFWKDSLQALAGLVEQE